MKAGIVTIRELMQGNKQGCLSAKRGLAQCFKCRLYNGLTRKGKVVRTPCQSRIVNLKYERLRDELEAEKRAHALCVERLEAQIGEM